MFLVCFVKINTSKFVNKKKTPIMLRLQKCKRKDMGREEREKLKRGEECSIRMKRERELGKRGERWKDGNKGNKVQKGEKKKRIWGKKEREGL